MNSPLRCAIRSAAVLLALLAIWAGPARAAREVRRHFPFIRPLLMGDAYVAVADEASAVFYNPAALALGQDNAYEAFNPQIIVNSLVDALLTNPDQVAAQYQNLDAATFQSLLGTRLYSQIDLRMPFITLARKNLAFGLGIEFLANAEVMGNPVIPSLHLEFHADAIAFVTMATQVTERMAVGITPKAIYRKGLDRVFTFGELFAAGATADISSNPDFIALTDKSYLEYGLDLGLVYRLPFWPGWQPRIGVSMLNVGSYTSEKGLGGVVFGQRPTPYDPPLGGELQQLNSIGFAVSPTYFGMRLTLAFDLVDVTQTVLPGSDWLKRTRLGGEIGVGVRDDGSSLFSLLGGLNGTHASFGMLSRIWFMEVGLGSYEVELGENAGDHAERFTVLLFGFRF